MSFPSRNCTISFSGVVLLSFVFACLQNTRLIRVECTFSTIPTCVNLPWECISSEFTVSYKGVLQGHLLFCCYFLHLLAVFLYFFHYRLSFFCDLLLDSVFPRIITIMCIKIKQMKSRHFISMKKKMSDSHFSENFEMNVVYFSKAYESNSFILNDFYTVNFKIFLLSL